MGDRAVAGFRADEDSPTIFLYQHWQGEGQATNLALALNAARPRWTDPSYATRIAISHLIGNEWGSETGFGLYADAGGGAGHGADYPFILVVEWATRKVLICDNADSASVVTEVDFDTFIYDPEGVVEGYSFAL